MELMTPYEIIDNLVESIEKTRKRNKIKQIDLCKQCDVPLSTYQKFIYKKTINLVSIIKIMYSLNMMKNLEEFIKYAEILTIEDIRTKNKKNKLPQRVRNSSE